MPDWPVRTTERIPLDEFVRRLVVLRGGSSHLYQMFQPMWVNYLGIHRMGIITSIQLRDDPPKKIIWHYGICAPTIDGWVMYWGDELDIEPMGGII